MELDRGGHCGVVDPGRVEHGCLQAVSDGCGGCQTRAQRMPDHLKVVAFEALLAGKISDNAFRKLHRGRVLARPKTNPLREVRR
jgi:hypothetical protein